MITLYVDKGKPYVWNSDDWYTLRSKYRICGAFIGSIASFARQNEFQGLPLALTSEEAALLVEKGICKLLENVGINENLSDEEKQKIKESEERIVKEQHDALRKRKIEQLSQKIDIIVAGKKKKMLSKGIVNVNIDKKAMLQEEIDKLPEVAPAHILVHLPTKHIIDSETREVLTNELHPSILDREGSQRYTIFKDLWEKGYYITNGIKFGADFLVYPGDPVKFHAKYMLRCVNEETAFRPAQLVAFGRLAVAVNKMAVFAFINSLGGINYQTLQWHDSI